MTDTLVPVLQRTLLFAGVLVVVGAVAWRVLIAPRAQARLDASLHDRLSALEPRIARVALWATMALILTWALRLHVQLLGFRDPFVPWIEDARFLVLETFWGSVWTAQGVLLVVLSSLFLRIVVRPGDVPAALEWGDPAPRPPLPLLWKLASAGVILLALSLALSSHAMGVPSNVPLAVGLDMAHLVAAGAWIGSLALILLVRPGRADAAADRGHPGSHPPHGVRTPLLAAQLRAFSPVAMVSVGVLVFAGVILSTQHVVAWENLWGSPYGRLLLAKIAVAGVIIALGAVNQRRGLPLLDTPDGAAATRRRAWTEVALAGLVLVLTAILTGTPMPEGTH